MSQGAATGNPALTLVLVLFMLGYVPWAVDRIAGLSRAVPAATAASMTYGHTAGSPALAPRLAACYKIAMAITMGYMLVMML